MAKFTTAAFAVGRLAVRGASNSRLLRAGYTAAQTTLRSFGHVLRMLWLQITGVFFCLFALSFAARLPRAYGKYAAGKQPASHFVLLACLAIVFAWFGVSSFWRA